MPDPTREQAIEACGIVATFAYGEPAKTWITHAATLLTRDGKLRERLKELVKAWRAEAAGCRARGKVADKADAHVMDTVADELEAALKED